MKYRAAVIGGGIFGTNIALELDKLPGLQTDLYEAKPDIMQEASKANHNRIHLGYHYLRSLKTARQSLSGLLTFMFNYGNAVAYQFPNHYGIEKFNSKTDAEGFVKFCQRLDIDYEESFPDQHILNRDMLEACFKVPEPVFDYQTLKKMIGERLTNSDVNIHLNHYCRDLSKSAEGFTLEVNGEKQEYDFVINASYKNFNQFNRDIDLDSPELLYQDVFIPIFYHPSPKFGLTVMDGPFCSIMPKGFEDNFFLLYHVVHSVLKQEHAYHTEVKGDLNEKVIEEMFKDSETYFPFLKNVKTVDTWRSMRVLYRNDDDSRLTEIYELDDIENYYAVLSGKITTCCKIARQIQQKIKDKVQ